MPDKILEEMYYALRIMQLVSMVFLPIGFFHVAAGHLHRLACIAARKDTGPATRRIGYGILLSIDSIAACLVFSSILQCSWTMAAVFIVTFLVSVRATIRLRPAKNTAAI